MIATSNTSGSCDGTFNYVTQPETMSPGSIHRHDGADTSEQSCSVGGVDWTNAPCAAIYSIYSLSSPYTYNIPKYLLFFLFPFISPSYIFTVLSCFGSSFFFLLRENKISTYQQIGPFFSLSCPYIYNYVEWRKKERERDLILESAVAWWYR